MRVSKFIKLTEIYKKDSIARFSNTASTDDSSEYCLREVMVNPNYISMFWECAYFKDQLMNPELDVERVTSKLERLIPKHLLSEIEMIIIGYFEEFEEKEISAFYKDGTLNISNFAIFLNNFYHPGMLRKLAHGPPPQPKTAYRPWFRKFRNAITQFLS